MEFKVHGQTFDDDKFWRLFEWLQDQKEGAKFNISEIANNPAGMLAHLKYYVDITTIHPEFVGIEFNEKNTMFKILQRWN